MYAQQQDTNMYQPDAYSPSDKHATAKSFDKTVIATYTGFAVFMFVIWKVFSYTFLSTLDHLLTFSAALQLMALGMLCQKVITHNCIDGISLKMLIFYAAAFILRLSSTLFFPGYVPEDGTADYWLYQMIEMAGLGATCWLIYQVTGPFRRQYNEGEDSMPHWYMVPVICVFLALLTHSDANSSRFFDCTWMTSQWLDSISMAPQLWMVSRAGKVERWTSHFIFWTVVSRVLLGLFWTLLQFNHPIEGWFSYGMTLSNIVHLVLCADYVYYFIMTFQQREMQLPRHFIDI